LTQNKLNTTYHYHLVISCQPNDANTSAPALSVEAIKIISNGVLVKVLRSN